MTGLGTPEIASTFGALDSAAVADGEAANAHTLRVLAKSANRLMCAGETVLTWVWDATIGAVESPGDGMLKGYGVAGLVLIAGPVVVAKKPGLRSMEVNVTARIAGSATCELLMTTSLNPRRDGIIGGPGAVVMTGDGSNDYQHFAATGIPCSADDRETLAFYIRGRPTTTLAASGTSTGTVGGVNYTGGSARIYDSGATFHASLPLAHVIQFDDGSSNRVTAQRLIVERVDANTLAVHPGFSVEEAVAVLGSTYKIYQLPNWRICCLNVNTETRTA